jgi:hypothetical protein
MSSESLVHVWDAPEHRLNHSEIPFKKTAIANAVHELLQTRSYTVKKWDSLASIWSEIHVVNFAQNVFVPVSSLEWKTIRVEWREVIMPSGTHFRAANEKQFSLVA